MNPDIRGSCTQRGAATLTVGLSLLTAVSIMSLVFAHTRVTEQEVTHSTLLGSETFAAAEAGLAFGRSWLSRHRPEWIDMKYPLQVSTPTSVMRPLKGNRGLPFAINVAFQRSLESPHYVLVKSDAQPGGKPGLLATVQTYVRPQTVLSESGESAPPLVIGGCITSVAGHPDIYPVDAHSAGTGGAIASAQEGCLKQGSIDLHGGIVIGKAFRPGKAWHYLFRISKTEMLALSNQEIEAGVPARDRHYWWASAKDLAGSKWQRSLGTPEQPVILIMPKELSCPHLGTGSVIYGIVYIEGTCDKTTPQGSARIYGSLVIEDNLAVFHQELRLLHISHASGSPEELKLPLIGAPMVPGTWKDF